MCLSVPFPVFAHRAANIPPFTQPLPVFAHCATPSHREFHCRGRDYRVLRAIEKSRESSVSEVEQKVVDEGDGSAGQQSDERRAELNKIGMEIKEALQRRKEKGEESLLSGVGKEIQEIEWPVFGKVLGATGVVSGVIAGLSVVLLTVNAVLAEISDEILAG